MKDSNIAKAARTPYAALAAMLFYISISGISWIPPYDYRRHDSAASPAKFLAIRSIDLHLHGEGFTVRSRVVAYDYQSLSVAWGGNSAVSQPQINLQLAVVLFITYAKNRERWKPWQDINKNAFDLTCHGPPLPPPLVSDRFHATLRQWSLPIHQRRRCSLRRHSATWID